MIRLSRLALHIGIYRWNLAICLIMNPAVMIWSSFK